MTKLKFILSEKSVKPRLGDCMTLLKNGKIRVTIKSEESSIGVLSILPDKNNLCGITSTMGVMTSARPETN